MESSFWFDTINFGWYTVKPVYNGHSQKDHKFVFKTYYGLMQVKSIENAPRGALILLIMIILALKMLKTGFILYRVANVRHSNGIIT